LRAIRGREDLIVIYLEPFEPARTLVVCGKNSGSSFNVALNSIVKAARPDKKPAATICT
jgi:hypothetical protein